MITKSDLTRWYPSYYLPCREGVYEMNNAFSKIRCFRYWDGNNWFFLAGSISDAAYFYFDDQTKSHLHLRWRGISQECFERESLLIGTYS